MHIFSFCFVSESITLSFCQERLANIGPEEFVQTFIPRDDADLRVRKFVT